MSAKLRVLALVHRHLIPPDTIDEGTDIVAAPWRTEYDVISTLTALGHEVQALGVHDDLGDIRRARRRSGSRTSPSTCSRGSTTSRSSTRTSSATWSC